MFASFPSWATASLPGFRLWSGPGRAETEDDRIVPQSVRLCGHANMPGTWEVEADKQRKVRTWCRICKEVERERWSNALEYAHSDSLYEHKRCDMIWRCVEHGPAPVPYEGVEVMHKLLRGRRTTNRLVGISFGEVDRSQDSIATYDREFLLYTLGLPRELVIDVRDVLERDPQSQTRGSFHDKRYREAVREHVMQDPDAKMLLGMLYLDWQRYGVIAVGCLGGNHRAPSILSMLEDLARSHGWQTCITHFGDVRQRHISPVERDRLLEQKKEMLQQL